MRYVVTLINGEQFNTDFVEGLSVLTPDGHVLSKTYICRAWDADRQMPVGLPHFRSLPTAHIVTILDNDAL